MRLMEAPEMIHALQGGAMLLISLILKMHALGTKQEIYTLKGQKLRNMRHELCHYYTTEVITIINILYKS